MLVAVAPPLVGAAAEETRAAVADKGEVEEFVGAPVSKADFSVQCALGPQAMFARRRARSSRSGTLTLHSEHAGDHCSQRVAHVEVWVTVHEGVE